MRINAPKETTRQAKRVGFMGFPSESGSMGARKPKEDAMRRRRCQDAGFCTDGTGSLAGKCPEDLQQTPHRGQNVVNSL